MKNVNLPPLPCPFCGSAASVDSNFGREFFVQCDALETCGATDGSINIDAATAIERWNRRPAAQAEPVAWIRYCSDGCYEEPIMDRQMEDCRKVSGSWTPLYADPQPAQAEPLTGTVD